MFWPAAGRPTATAFCTLLKCTVRPSPPSGRERYTSPFCCCVLFRNRWNAGRQVCCHTESTRARLRHTVAVVELPALVVHRFHEQAQPLAVGRRLERAAEDREVLLQRGVVRRPWVAAGADEQV